MNHDDDPRLCAETRTTPHGLHHWSADRPTFHPSDEEHDVSVASRTCPTRDTGGGEWHSAESLAGPRASIPDPPMSWSASSVGGAA